MPTAIPKSAFWHGFRAGIPFILGAFPFGLLFGIVATEAGFDIVQVMGMTVIVIAGAAQFTALAQMQDNAPIFMILAASLAVNMRMAMYSASIAPYFVGAPLWKRAAVAYGLIDFTYVAGIAEFEKQPEWEVTDRLRFYLGSAVPSFASWYLSTFLGAWFGRSIPPEFSLDFAPAIVFLAIVAPMLKSPAHVAAALTSVILALLLAFLPFSSGLLIAAAAAMLVGSEVERRMLRSPK